MGRFLRFAIFMGVLLSAYRAMGANEAMQSFTLSGPVYQAGTTAPLLDSNLKIKVQILNPAKTCVLYEEQQTFDTQATGGTFNVQVGSAYPNAKRTAGDPGNSMALIYQNMAPIPGNNVSGQNCGGSYTPVAGATRYFRVTFTPSSTNTPDTMNPDIALGSVPSAMVAQSLQGLERAAILQVRNDASYSLTQANLESAFSAANYPRLSALLSGASTQYLAAAPTAPVAFNGQRLSSLADPVSAQDAATKAYVDSSLAGLPVDMSAVGPGFGNGKTLVWDSVMARWMAGSSPGVGLIVAGSGLTGGSITSSGVLSVDTGTTANKVVQLNGSAQLPAVDGSRLTNVNAVKLQGRPVSSGGATTGQVLGWNGSQWEPTTVSPGSGGGAVTSVAGRTGAVVLSASDISGLGSAASLSAGVAAGNVVALNGTAQLPAVDGSQLTGVNAAKLGGRTVSVAAPSTGQSLVWNGTQWMPQTVSVGSGGGGGITDLTGDVTASGSGAVSATIANNAITTAKVRSTGGGVNRLLITDATDGSTIGFSTCAVGEILKWTASGWSCATASGSGTVTAVIAGTGLTGGSITSAGVLSVDVGSTAGKVVQLNGSGQLPPVDGSLLTNVNSGKLQSRSVSSAVPSTGQALVWNGSVWEPNSSLAIVSGRVGIGTTAPMAVLDVSASGSASALIVPRESTANRPFGVNGMIRYNTTISKLEAYENGAWVSFTTSSDARLKKNVAEVDNALGMIERMRPVYFDWDFANPKAAGYPDKHQVGFIAQDLEQVLPEVVNVGGDGYRTVEYGKIVSIAIAAAKELQAKVRALTSENAQLKAQLEKQGKDLEEIKRRLNMP